MSDQNRYREPCSKHEGSPTESCVRCGFPRWDHLSSKEIESEIEEVEKRFPIQGGFSVTWGDAGIAYTEYQRRYGKGGQTLGRIAERGGFGLLEFVSLYDKNSLMPTLSSMERSLVKTLRESSLRVED